MKCKTCGKKAESEYCFHHKPRKAMPKYTKLSREVIKDTFQDLIFMGEFFLQIWKKRPHKSEVSGEKIHGELLSTYFHHILPKHLHRMAQFDEENIIILLPEEHENVEIDMYRYEEINKRREQLKVKYGLI